MDTSQKSLQSELAERASLTTKVLEHFIERPFVWVDVRTLAEIGGFAGWRTRVSQARQIVTDRQCGAIEWNNQIKASAYRYVPVLVRPEQSAQQMEMFQ